ncbi:putative ABC transport system ATP-binding protein [Defluviimonas denitrificans]|jgi:putative ABC transport system ATP-binding protein|uniref:Putative ABC transport system ATP-binding protein n=1 Tax=Albidovulum denitrificans TaxID=404881 RepID=A0A2S8S5G1_9RHOB|nr:ABC transporter ATP-binding protein [Defluviimonas denitrificans]PQV56040.1 putative ABC transport system ATP-binding protein [Defluviimonas denitrificans]
MSDPIRLQSFITLSEIDKSYRMGGQTVPIFQDLSLTIEQGEFVAVMGPSGSGKSTILNMLGGIDRPDRGKLTIGNSQLHRMGEGALTAWRAQHVGIVFQFYNLLPMLTAAQNVEIPLLLKPLNARSRRERIRTVLDLVGIGDRAHHLPSQLSGGQQQRVGIARALISDPQLLLCDEPTGDLDRKSATEIMEMLQFLNKELGKTIVMVTHDPESTRYADRTLFLNKGVFESREVAA